jgi:hypothetical protein
MQCCFVADIHSIDSIHLPFLLRPNYWPIDVVPKMNDMPHFHPIMVEPVLMEAVAFLALYSSFVSDRHLPQ